MDDFLATNSLSHLAPCFAEISLETLFARVESTNRVQFLQQLKDEFGVALLPDRQKLANALRKAASRAAKGWSDDMAAKVSSPDSIAPLIVRSMYGMGNQLRVLLSYRAAANAKGRALVLHWQPDAACPGKFRDFYEPLDGCLVVDSLHELGQFRKEWGNLGSHLPYTAIEATANVHPDIEGTQQEAEMWRDLTPNAAVKAAVDERIRQIGRDFIAVHVRRTDHKIGGHRHEHRRTTDQSFYDWIDCQPRDLPIFVATDNKHTQERFVQRYGSHRIKGIKPITKAFEPLVNGVVDRAAISGKVGDAGGGVISNDIAFRCEDVHRHTPLFDAVVDIFTCVQAKAFKGSFYSSFSDAIMRLRNVRGTASEDDEHDLTLPDFHVQYAGNSHDASVSLDDPRLIERAREMAAELSAATTPIS